MFTPYSARLAAVSRRRPTVIWGSRPLQTALLSASSARRSSAPTPSSLSRTQQLAAWSAALRYEDLPPVVVEKTKDFFLDWYACAVGGRHHPAVKAIDAFAREQGPSLTESGGSELLHVVGKNRTSAAFAALVNGAASHVVEQDDLHNSSMVHPATVVFPAALAVAQSTNATGKDLITACVAGYDVACRIGEFLGPSHYAKFHTTATAGVYGATAAASHLLRLDSAQTLSALGTAGTQAAGLWQFLVDATHSKQVHTAKASFDGVFSAYATRAGLLGTADVLEGTSGMAAAMVPGTPSPEALTRNLGGDYSILHSSFKWHASCRHTHGSADGLLQIMKDHSLQASDIQSVTCHVYKAALDVLGRTAVPETVHQSKFSMGFVLAVAAHHGRATVLDFTEEALQQNCLHDFASRVTMVLDNSIEAVFPDQWQSRVVVTTTDGRTLEQFVETAKGDPEQHLTRDELQEKARRIAEYANIKDMQALEGTFKRVWKLEGEKDLTGFSVV
ncbi:hypothetical protein SEUCBS140593_002723 [Sporothrix eucalyptigena]|uniref:2-methylcitrate dehydratase n=1 Tax=Sporothrix eucalyptigena TaxID=1812306 RepID=A0ABP0B918_9PEZI